MTNLNVADLVGNISDAQLPPDVALLDATIKPYTGRHTFTGNGHSFIIDTGGGIATNLFTGLSLQYYPKLW